MTNRRCYSSILLFMIAYRIRKLTISKHMHEESKKKNPAHGTKISRWPSIPILKQRDCLVWIIPEVCCHVVNDKVWKNYVIIMISLSVVGTVHYTYYEICRFRTNPCISELSEFCGIAVEDVPLNDKWFSCYFEEEFMNYSNSTTQ